VRDLAELTDLLAETALRVPEEFWRSNLTLAESGASEFNVAHALNAMAHYRDAMAERPRNGASVVFWHTGLAAAARRLNIVGVSA